ncbi:MAG: cell envelope biogenesis protein TolA [Rhodobacteraceae bacterium]|nr:cell envelope biogenesis protein TolA [Paracoccaceae bacterium]
MHIGHYISGAAHLGLIGWMLVGDVFEPPPFEVTEVAILSEEQFLALAQPPVPDAQPRVAPDDPVAPVAPEPPEDAEAPADPDPIAEPKPEPDPVPSADPEVEQEPRPQVPALPQPDTVPFVDARPPQDPIVLQDPPVLVAPEPEVLPEPEPDVAPVASIRPQARPAPRVAPEPVVQPDPDVELGEVDQPAVDPEGPAEDVKEQQDAEAPEAAARDIVTEAEKAEAQEAPVASLRPRARPRPLVAEDAQTPIEDSVQQEAREPETQAAVKAALAAVLGGNADATTDSPLGPPLSAGEQDALRAAVQDCWVVDVGSQAANVTVVVGMDMERSGRVISSTIRLVSATGGTGAAVETAFQAARRAILRCQKGGYPLPPEKFDQWKEIEMTFNPSKMRLR